MYKHETPKFTRIGISYILIISSLGVILPTVLALLICIKTSQLDAGSIFSLTLIFILIACISLLMPITWGDFSKPFIRHTAKEIQCLPYSFDSSFSGRAGMLYIDTTNGIIGFISSYNPFKLQIFSASRLDKITTICSTWSGFRFCFYLDGYKISMMTLLTNTIVNPQSKIGIEAQEKAQLFANLLQTA